MATCSLDVCPLAERISSRVQDSIVCTSGRNLGTLIVTNGFLRTSAYVIISISFAAPPKKIRCQTTNHPSLHCGQRSGFITARRPPNQMCRNLRTTKLIPQTTSYSNFIVIAAFFVRRDHGQFRPTNLESMPFHRACHHDGIITRGPLLHKIAPT